MTAAADPLLEAARAAAAEVLSNEEHTAGIGHTALRVTAVERRTAVVRVVGVVEAPGELGPWGEPNVAVRLQLIDPADSSSVSRIYTARRVWPTDGELSIEIDLVRHGHPTPGMRWADSVAAGDVVPLTGPRPHQVPAVDGCARSIWLADASALPAVHSLIANWVAPTPVQVVAAVDEHAPLAELPQHDLIEVRRAEPGPGVLLDAVRSMHVDARTSIWGAGERTEVRAIREWAVEVAGVDPQHVRAFGYWHSRRTATQLDAQRILFYKARLDRGLGMDGVDDLEIPD